MSIKFFRDSEKQIFLHFLNREAYEACGGYANHVYVASMLELLTVSHCSRMSVNISQFLEFSGSNKAFLNEVFFLTSHKIIELQSQSSSPSEFIASRQSLYEHDRGRYPMYFGENAYFAENFSISSINRMSTTSLLQKAILDFSPGPLFADARGPLSEVDWKVISPKFEQVQIITAMNRHKAVTKALYKAHSNPGTFSPREIDILGKLASGLYVQNYRAKSRYALCSGVMGLAYYDDYSDFPFYDLELIPRLLKLLGYDYLKVTLEGSLQEQRAALYATPVHNRFVAHFNALLGALARMIHLPDHLANDKIALRTQMLNVLVTASVAMTKIGQFYSLEDFFEKSCKQIAMIARYISISDGTFKNAWSEYMEPTFPRKKVLFLTATDIEDEKLIEELERIGIKEDTPKKVKNNFVRVFQTELPLQVYHIRSGAGSSGSNGSTLVAGEAIDALTPDYVISVGICFGANKDKQKIGDVLVSRAIYQYEPGRLTEKDFKSRGENLPASGYLVQVCQSLKIPDAKRHLGLIASGEKLVDSIDFVKFLHEQQSEFIGGEMEGSGISAASQRHKADWIMIKAICDWGYEKNKDDQPLAAQNSARYASRVLQILATADG
ncbi:5'-methylthioadenosine/S-adenosylhomocysteine nucleosidase family protein [Azospirillum melinis]